MYHITISIRGSGQYALSRFGLTLDQLIVIEVIVEGDEYS